MQINRTGSQPSRKGPSEYFAGTARVDELFKAAEQGHSLTPLFHGNTPAGWQRSMYYHYYEFAPPHWVFPHYGIRTDRYKL
ncbi:MAG TPA: sulfatase/phosphatase domain-containing protein, partial [Terracidiphilus sp.]|nr:sulfatase/phosphatase domain-containing protein [Terracidiphilus sp.]